MVIALLPKQLVRQYDGNRKQVTKTDCVCINSRLDLLTVAVVIFETYLE